MSSFQQRKTPPEVIVDPAEFSRLPEMLELVCQTCGHVAEYDFGTLVLSADSAASPLGQREFEDIVSSTGYLRCHQCRASGQWRFTDRSRAEVRLKLTDMMVENRLPQGVVIGKSVLFDGTTSRDLAEGEDYLRGRIAKTPDDFYLHSRLANLLLKVDLTELADVELRRALELNPRDAESWYDHGCNHQENDRRDEAIHAFQQALRYASQTTHIPTELLQEIVQDSISRMLELHKSPELMLEFMPIVEPEPKPQHQPTAQDSKAEVAALRSVNLKTMEGLIQLAGYYFYGTWQAPARPTAESSVPSHHIGMTRRESDFVATPVLTSRRVGRNEPCSCGSGKKSKKCCNS